MPSSLYDDLKQFEAVSILDGQNVWSQNLRFVYDLFLKNFLQTLEHFFLLVLLPAEVVQTERVKRDLFDWILVRERDDLKWKKDSELTIPF